MKLVNIIYIFTFCSPCWWCATTTLHLPAGWEGWGLHQPPRVQNRPSHRVQTEIVSAPRMSPKLVIKHICSHPHNVYHKTLISPLLPAWLQCLQSLSPQNQELLLRHRLSWGNEQVSEREGLSAWALMWTIVKMLETSRVHWWIFQRSKESLHKATPHTTLTLTRHDSGPLSSM